MARRKWTSEEDCAAAGYRWISGSQGATLQTVKLLLEPIAGNTAMTRGFQETFANLWSKLQHSIPAFGDGAVVSNAAKPFFDRINIDLGKQTISDAVENTFSELLGTVDTDRNPLVSFPRGRTTVHLSALSLAQCFLFPTVVLGELMFQPSAIQAVGYAAIWEREKSFEATFALSRNRFAETVNDVDAAIYLLLQLYPPAANAFREFGRALTQEGRFATPRFNVQAIIDARGWVIGEDYFVQQFSVAWLPHSDAVPRDITLIPKWGVWEKR